jgi:RecA-family ATPase
MSIPSRSTLDEVTFTATELMAFEFPEAQWAVPGMIPEGVTLLAGKPKLGKSWGSLGIGVAVATGGKPLGKVRVERGEVLYLALEDNLRRLQRRLQKLLAGDAPPAGLQ